jgi:hypothetical protein
MPSARISAWRRGSSSGICWNQPCIRPHPLGRVGEDRHRHQRQRLLAVEVEPDRLQPERRLAPFGELGLAGQRAGGLGGDRFEHLPRGLPLHAEHLGEDVGGFGGGFDVAGHGRHHRADCGFWEGRGARAISRSFPPRSCRLPCSGRRAPRPRRRRW